MKPEQRTPSTDPADSYRLEHQVGYWLRRAYQRHMAIFAGIMSDLDLTSMQFAALVKLHELKAVSQTELGRLTGMDRIGRVTEQTLEPIGAADRESLRSILQKMG